MDDRNCTSSNNLYPTNCVYSRKKEDNGCFLKMVKVLFNVRRHAWFYFNRKNIIYCLFLIILLSEFIDSSSRKLLYNDSNLMLNWIINSYILLAPVTPIIYMSTSAIVKIEKMKSTHQISFECVQDNFISMRQPFTRFLFFNLITPSLKLFGQFRNICRYYVYYTHLY